MFTTDLPHWKNLVDKIGWKKKKTRFVLLSGEIYNPPFLRTSFPEDEY